MEFNLTKVKGEDEQELLYKLEITRNKRVHIFSVLVTGVGNGFAPILKYVGIDRQMFANAVRITVADHEMFRSEQAAIDAAKVEAERYITDLR